MINSILIIMASAIKGMVSKNKIRYKEDGFDLDLSYISRNIIAMGFPAEKLERFYRNHMDDVVRFFETKHKNRYKIYNLCSENKRRYDTTKFQGRVDERYSFQDHNPPPFELLKPFCESVHSWLTQDPKNVAAIHCKAGKGRTGVMICAYLIHAGECEIVDESNCVKITTAHKALEYYGRHRTHDKKGVTIPSQMRYVYYYEELVKQNLEYEHLTLRLNAIRLESIPTLNGGAYTLICEIIQLPKQKLKTYEMEVKKGFNELNYYIPDELTFRGDIKIEFYIKNKIKREKIFQFCFNTFFVKSDGHDIFRGNHSFCDSKGCSLNKDCTDNQINGYTNGQINTGNNRRPISCRRRINSEPNDTKGINGKELTLILPKSHLDKAYKDKANRTFKADFKVQLSFTKPVQPYTGSPDYIHREENTLTSDGLSNHDSHDSHGSRADGDGSTDNESETEDEDEDEYSETDEDVERGGETTYL